MHLVTIEGFMIPLNVRNHTLHVHRAMKTRIRQDFLTFHYNVPYFAVSPSFKVRFFMTLLIFGKPQVFPAEKKTFYHFYYFSFLSNNETAVGYTIMENKTFWFNYYKLTHIVMDFHFKKDIVRKEKRYCGFRP